MFEKFEIYDVLGVLVPGVLVVCSVPLAFPFVALGIGGAQLPEGFSLIGLTAASVFAGFVVQAIASIAETLLFWTWGGRPSERALDKGLGDRYLPAASGARIRAKLLAAAEPNASTRSLFLIAMQRAESCGSARVSRFNALYAYHRALVVLTALALVLFVVSFYGGLASRLSSGQDAWIIAVIVLLLVLFWYRAKQRGFYYVREVLLCDEQHLSAPSDSTAR